MSPPGGKADWLGYTEALDAILARSRPLEGEPVPLAEATGRALAEEVRSRVDHPPWDNSAMDGFAVRAADVAGASPDAPVTLPVSGEVPAGGFPAGPLRPGEAVQVMTGAPVPEGTTGVIRVEHTDGGRDGRVRFYRESDAERNIRRAGEDVRSGDMLLAAGEEVTAAATGALALTGRGEVAVVPRPRVGVLANGDELASFGEFEEVLAGRKIMDSNGPALAAAIRAVGGVPVPLGIARDDPVDIRERLRGLDRCDALVTAAGVSVGERDHVRDVLKELGLELVFWRVRVRPGSSLAFGVLEDKPVWAVPGNPVSALVAFETFVRPGLRRIGGHARTVREPIRVRVRDAVEAPEDFTCFYRVRLQPASDGPPWAALTGPQGSGILTSMVAADALLVLPAGVPRVEAGEEAEALRLRSWRRPGSATSA